MAGGLTVSTVMKFHRFCFIFACLFAVSLSQTTFAQDDREHIEIKPPEEVIIPDLETAPDDTDIITEEPTPEIDKPDYSHLTPKAERRPLFAACAG